MYINRIRKAIAAQRITQEELCRRVGCSRDAIVDGISADTACKLEFMLGDDLFAGIDIHVSESEMSKARSKMEAGFCSAEAKAWAQKFPVAELRRLNRIPAQCSNKDGSLVKALLKFFNVATIEGWKTYYANIQDSVNPQAYSAWLRLGELQVSRPAAEIAIEKEAILENMKFLRRNALGLRNALRKAAISSISDCDVQVVQVPAFLTAPAPLSASYWVGKRPVIQIPAGPMTDVRLLQGLFHQLYHIMYGKRSLCLQLGLQLSQQPSAGIAGTAGGSANSISGDTLKCSAAEQFAERHMLTEAEECEIICCGHFAEKHCIDYFAGLFHVRPSIIVDRLQQQKKLSSRTLLNSYKVAV